MGRRRGLTTVVVGALTLAGCTVSSGDDPGPGAGTPQEASGTTTPAADLARGTTPVPRVVARVDGQTLEFTQTSAVLVCEADRGEAEIVVQGDGAEIVVRVPAARHPEDTVVEMLLPDGSEWRRADTGPECCSRTARWSSRPTSARSAAQASSSWS